jgi:hypothetical protein
VLASEKQVGPWESRGEAHGARQVEGPLA